MRLREVGLQLGFRTDPDIFLCRHIHTVNCSLLTRDYRFRGKVRQNLLKMQIFYREIPQNRHKIISAYYLCP